MEAFSITEWTLTLSPHEEEDEIMTLRRDEMAIRNMMQMKQAGFDATLRDTTDNEMLEFDYSQPDPQEVAAAQEAAAAEQQQQGGGQQGGAVQTSMDELEMTPEMLFKRTEFTPNRGGSKVIPESVVTSGDLPALRTIGDSQMGERNSGGESPQRIKRVDGAPSMATTRGDKRDDRTAAERAVDHRLKEMERRGGSKGQR